MTLEGLELIHRIVHISNYMNHLHNITIKLDLSKTFDHVEWPFLSYIIQRLDFPPHMIYLIYLCLSTSKIVIIYNHSITPLFKPSRGLHQGNHVSPSPSHFSPSLYTRPLIYVEGISTAKPLETYNSS